MIISSALLLTACNAATIGSSQGQPSAYPVPPLIAVDKQQSSPATELKSPAFKPGSAWSAGGSKEFRRSKSDEQRHRPAKPTAQKSDVTNKSEGTFGHGVSSPWAKTHLDKSHHADFGKMVKQAATIGASRLELPGGKTLLASALFNSGRCSKIEVSVTLNGTLPILERGSAKVCS